jgi:hypothetical protein
MLVFAGKSSFESVAVDPIRAKSRSARPGF